MTISFFRLIFFCVDVLQAQSLVEASQIVKPKGHEEPSLGQAGRDVESALQPGIAEDLRLLTRFARCLSTFFFLLGVVFAVFEVMYCFARFVPFLRCILPFRGVFCRFSR